MTAAPRLVVCGASSRFCAGRGDRPYVYRIGGATVEGDYRDLNDAGLLNRYALELRDEYAAWVYRHNARFVEDRLVEDGTSLFFLTDFSCKRTELFETYRSICNIHVLREKLRGADVSSALFVGLDDSFVDAFRSAFPRVRIHTRDVRSGRPAWRAWLADARYLTTAITAAALNATRSRTSGGGGSGGTRHFLTSFPNMFGRGARESKYASLVGPGDRFAVAVLTDGFHQSVGPTQYARLRSEARGRADFDVIDDAIRPRDIVRGLYWLARLAAVGRRHRSARYVFAGIDISAYVRYELRISFSRLWRLMMLRGAFDRFFTRTEPREVVYYLHEHPYGRLVSAVLGTRHPTVRRTGFQHGPASWRKLVYFMARGEGSSRPPYIAHAPIPDTVLAEDEESARIYEHAGYQGVRVMDRVYRLWYLDEIRPRRDPALALIAPGLHDGELLVRELEPVITGNPRTTFLLKPHPLASRAYLESVRHDNVTTTDESVAALLAKVGTVYVTYSSVGQEAKRLGIDVVVVDVPGLVNESPLAYPTVET